MVRHTIVSVAAAALVLATPVLSAPAGSAKLVVDHDDLDTRAELLAKGAVLVEDYGSFSLWRLEGFRVGALGSRARRTVRDDLDVIAFRGRRLDTRAVPPSEPPALRQTRRTAPQLWLVQFVGPIKARWLSALREAGAQVVGPISGTAYVIWADGATLDRIGAQADGGGPIQWSGPYHPLDRLAPALHSALATPERLLDVTVQLYTTPDVEASLAALRERAAGVLREPWAMLGFTNVVLRLPAGSLAVTASRADVFNVEPWSEPRRLDERQGQIAAGNVTVLDGATVPAGPGYLDWLRAQGFPASPSSYPIVAVTDDGLDNGSAEAPGHPDFREGGLSSAPSRIAFVKNCTTSPRGDSPGGHGTLDAAIVGAYNDRPGPPHVDADGYALDMGVAPFGRLGMVKIFNDGGSFELSGCGGSDASMVANVHQAGAAITSNSWGGFTGGVYDVTAQQWDALARDARPDLGGNQEMLHVFSAGNSGPFGLDSPAVAKNVLAVGATENVRDQGVADRCFVVDADNADDVAAFSSQGPASDGRARPDLVAPGTHIQGAATQDPAFNGRSLCGHLGDDIRYYPPVQTLYTWSSGTSHAAPAVAGAAALAWQYYQRVLAPGRAPSPAMLRALLVNSARYLGGSGAGDSLPGAGQGWGALNFGALFDGTPRVVVDQGRALRGTGVVRAWTGRVLDPDRPLRLSLVWTDAPGAPTGGAALVNDLDLEVRLGGQEYRGNVFAGAFSVAGGDFDHRNTVENVFLPAGAAGDLVVRVIARNLAADGVPGDDAELDQDFALVITNAEAAPVLAPELALAERRVSDTGPGANGVVEPGDRLLMELALENSGPATATGVTATLRSLDTGVRVVNGHAAYMDIRPGHRARPNTPFTLALDEALPCGGPLHFELTVAADSLEPAVQAIVLDSGTIIESQARFTYGGPPVPFEPLSFAPNGARVGAPSNSHLAEAFARRHDFRFGPETAREGGPAGFDDYPTYAYYQAVVPIEVSLPAPGTVRDVDVHVDMTHPAVEELFFDVHPPAGHAAPALSFFSASGANFTDTTFDDEAPLSIVEGTAPYSGRFRPFRPLSDLDGTPAAGLWKLQALDVFAGNDGVVNAFCLDITFDQFVCATPMPAPPPDLLALSPSTVLAGAPATVTAHGRDFVADSAVYWNGERRPTAYVSDRKLVFVLSEADLAQGETGLVTVVTPAPGGGTSPPVRLGIRRPSGVP